MLKKLLLVSTTLLCVAAGSNLVIARTQKILADTRHEHGKIDHHKTMEIPAGQPIPSVDLSVHKDPMKGYNLQAKVSNFRFAL